MTKNQRSLRFAMLIALAATSSKAESDPYRWYVGGSFGSTSLGHGVADLSDEPIDAARIDDVDTGWKVYAGQRFNKYFSLEVSFVDLNNDFDGETSLSGLAIDIASSPAEVLVSVDIDEPRAVAFGLVGSLPLSDRAALLAKAGASSWSADVTTVNREGRSTRSESGIDPLFGAGFEFRASRRVELRLEWERYADVADVDTDLLSFGLLVRF